MERRAKSHQLRETGVAEPRWTVGLNRTVEEEVVSITRWHDSSSGNGYCHAVDCPFLFPFPISNKTKSWQQLCALFICRVGRSDDLSGPNTNSISLIGTRTTRPNRRWVWKRRRPAANINVQYDEMSVELEWFMEWLNFYCDRHGNRGRRTGIRVPTYSNKPIPLLVFYYRSALYKTHARARNNVDKSGPAHIFSYETQWMFHPFKSMMKPRVHFMPVIPDCGNAFLELAPCVHTRLLSAVLHTPLLNSRIIHVHECMHI